MPPRNVAIVQLSTTTQTFIFPIKRMCKLGKKTLANFLSSEDIKKVGLNCRGDAARLSSQYNMHVANLHDVAHLFNQHFPTEKRRWSLANLVARVLECHLPKPLETICGNWEQWPLSRDQLTYASNDSLATVLLYHAISDGKVPHLGSAQMGRVDRASIAERLQVEQQLLDHLDDDDHFDHPEDREFLQALREESGVPVEVFQRTAHSSGVAPQTHTSQPPPHLGGLAAHWRLPPSAAPRAPPRRWGARCPLASPAKSSPPCPPHRWGVRCPLASPAKCSPPCPPRRWGVRCPLASPAKSSPPCPPRRSGARL